MVNTKNTIDFRFISTHPLCAIKINKTMCSTVWLQYKMQKVPIYDNKKVNQSFNQLNQSMHGKFIAVISHFYVMSQQTKYVRNNQNMSEKCCERVPRKSRAESWIAIVTVQQAFF